MKVAMLHIREHYAKILSGFATRTKRATGATSAPDFLRTSPKPKFGEHPFHALG